MFSSFQLCLKHCAAVRFYVLVFFLFFLVLHFKYVVQNHNYCMLLKSEC